MKTRMFRIGVMRGIIVFLSWVLAELGMVAHNKPPLIAQPTPRETAFGAPLPGLTAQQLQQFAVGLAQFKTADAISDGLGPIFNGQSYVASHAVQAVGGSSAITETRFRPVGDPGVQSDGK
jgi:hypothetical protein